MSNEIREKKMFSIKKGGVLMGKLSDDAKITAFLLNENYGYSMAKIGEIFGVSRQTISLAVNTIKLRIQIEELESEIKKAEKEIRKKGYSPLKVTELPPFSETNL